MAAAIVRLHPLLRSDETHHAAASWTSSVVERPFSETLVGKSRKSQSDTHDEDASSAKSLYGPFGDPKAGSAYLDGWKNPTQKQASVFLGWEEDIAFDQAWALQRGPMPNTRLIPVPIPTPMLPPERAADATAARLRRFTTRTRRDAASPTDVELPKRVSNTIEAITVVIHAYLQRCSAASLCDDASRLVRERIRMLMAYLLGRHELGYDVFQLIASRGRGMRLEDSRTAEKVGNESECY